MTKAYGELIFIIIFTAICMTIFWKPIMWLNRKIYLHLKKYYESHGVDLDEE